MFIFCLKSLVAIFFVFSLPFFCFSLQSFGVIHSNIESKRIGLVLGAGVRPDGTPSWILKNRLDAAFELYKSKRVDILLVSGDNRFEHYNEPKVMKQYLLAKGIPDRDIEEDFAGRRTFDSCWRAKNVFKAKNVTVVTQAFHITRSVFLCQSMGLETSFETAQDADRFTVINGVMREIPASCLAIFEIIFDNGNVVQGDGTERNLGV